MNGMNEKMHNGTVSNAPHFIEESFRRIPMNRSIRANSRLRGSAFSERLEILG